MCQSFHFLKSRRILECINCAFYISHLKLSIEIEFIMAKEELWKIEFQKIWKSFTISFFNLVHMVLKSTFRFLFLEVSDSISNSYNGEMETCNLLFLIIEFANADCVYEQPESESCYTGGRALSSSRLIIKHLENWFNFKRSLAIFS